MSRLPEFMSQVHVKRFGSSVILIILRLFSFPELTLILLQVALLRTLTVLNRLALKILMIPRGNNHGPSLTL